MALSPAQQRARHAAASVDRLELEPGEVLQLNYAHEAAGCGCPPTHTHLSLPAIAVARSGEAAGRRGGGRLSRTVDRCLSCGVRWKAKGYAWEPTVLVGAEAA